VQIPNHRWVAQEGRWIINDGKGCDVRGLTRTKSGDLLLVVSHGGQKLLRSGDNGVTWSEEMDLGKRYNLKGMTDGWATLRSGRILAVVYRPGWGKIRNEGAPYDTGPAGRKALIPFVYEHPGGVTQSARCVYSDDEGHTWKLTDPLPMPEDLEYRPLYGRIVEMPDGTVLLTGHTFTSKEDQRAWIFSSCILRSRDQGLTWGDMTVVAHGESDIGNCYNETAVLTVQDGRWLAFFRMNPTHYGLTLYGFRCFSSDNGRTWSPPEQCLQGPAEMDMLHLADGGMMVTGVSLSGTLYTLSYDGGQSWAYQGHIYDRHPKERQWDWHYSYTVQLDRDTLLSVFSRQNDQRVFGTYARWIRRTEIVAMPESRSAYTPGDGPADRWVLRELRPVYRGKDGGRNPQICRASNGDLLVSVQVGTPPKRTVVVRSTDSGLTWEAPVQVCESSSSEQAGGYGMITLKRGRVVMAYGESQIKTGAHEPAGEFMPGNPRFRVRGFQKQTVLRAAISDDNGQRWRLGDAIDFSPFVSASPGGGLIELSNGHLLMPVYGPLNPDDMDQAMDSCGVLRSQDGGETWTRFAVVAAADLGAGRSFRKLSALPSADGNLIAAIETFYPTRGPNSERTVSFSVSSDGGKTWSAPLATMPGHDPLLARLPDGSVFFAQSVWTGIKFEVSYNDAVTWAYQDQLYYRDPRQEWGAGSVGMVALDGRTALAVYHLPGGGVDASWIRRVPRQSKQARERFE